MPIAAARTARLEQALILSCNVTRHAYITSFGLCLLIVQLPILNQCIAVISRTLTEERVGFSGECANVRPNYYLMRPNRQINGLIIKVL